MKIYLASPFFNEDEKRVYNHAIHILRSQGYDVFVPQEHEIPNGWEMPNPLWAEAVFAVDYLAIQKCDVMVVLNWGMYSDTGTAWECGCAYAMGKKIVNILCGDEPESGEYSLMMLNGCNTYITFADFEKHWFGDVLEDKVAKPTTEQK